MTEPEKSSKNLFSVSQRRIVASGATGLAAVVLVTIAFCFFLLLRSFVGTFQDVLLPLAIAAILATLLRPIVTVCETRTRLSRVQGIALLYFLVIGALVAAALFAVPALLAQAGALIDHAAQLKANLAAFLRENMPGAWQWLGERLGQPPDEYLKQWMAEHSEMLQGAAGKVLGTAGSIGGFMAGLFGKVATYAVIPVYLFFILNGDRDVWKDIQRQLDFLPDERRDDLVFLVRQFSEILIAFFRGQIIIGLLLGAVLATGFFLVGLEFGILIGIVLGLLNIIPYLGTVLGIITVTPLAYFQDGGGGTLILLCGIVFVIGQLLTDYVFTPRVMGDKTGMGPMLIIFSVFFWGTALGGILGMVLAIPLTAFFLVFWRLAREKYLPALTAKREKEDGRSEAPA